MLATDKYARLIRETARMDKKKVYIEKRYLIPATKNKLPVLSLSKQDSFLEHAVFRMWSMLSDK